MPLQSSGAISLNQIHVEAGGTSGTTASINDSDIRALISKASGATMSFNEWYGASATNPFTGFVGTGQNVPSGTFTIPSYGQAEAGNAEEMGARIKLTFGSSSFSYVVEDFSTESTNIGSGYSSNFFARSVTSQGASITWPENAVSTSKYFFTSATGTTVNYSGGADSVTDVEVRWVITDGRMDFQPGDDQDEYLRARYCTNYVDNATPTPDTSTGLVVNIVRGNADNFNVDYTDQWRNVTPTIFGGSSATGNVVLCDLYTQVATDTTSSERVAFNLSSSGSIKLQIRVRTSTDNTYTYTLTKPYVSSTEPQFIGESDDD